MEATNYLHFSYNENTVFMYVHMCVLALVEQKPAEPMDEKVEVVSSFGSAFPSPIQYSNNSAYAWSHVVTREIQYVL